MSEETPMNDDMKSKLIAENIHAFPDLQKAMADFLDLAVEHFDKHPLAEDSTVDRILSLKEAKDLWLSFTPEERQAIRSGTYKP